MQNYNEASFALLGILEQVDNAVLSFSVGEIGVSDLQQGTQDAAAAISQFASSDSAYSDLASQAQAFADNYTGASSWTAAQASDFQGLVDSTYSAVLQDSTVSDSATLTYMDIYANVGSDSWGEVFNAPVIEESNDVASEFFDIEVDGGSMFISMDSDAVVSGDYASAFEYSVYMETADGSEVFAGEMYVYVEYCGTYNPDVEMDAVQPEVIYDYTYDYSM